METEYKHMNAVIPPTSGYTPRNALATPGEHMFGYIESLQGWDIDCEYSV